MTNTVVVSATYERAADVPNVGRRKRMRVNGKYETLTLTSITATRRHFYGEDGYSHGFKYDTEETWGPYLSGGGQW